MAKSSKEQIETDEKKVVAVLKTNAKESIDTIAQKCGFSRQKVWRIINRLEKDKTIWGYNAVVDDTKLGQKRFFILLKRTSKSIPKEKLNIILNREVPKQGEKIGVTVESSYFIHGMYDSLLFVTAKDTMHVKKYCDKLSFFLKEGYVKEIHILEVIFPIQVNGLNNPNMEEFLKFF